MQPKNLSVGQTQGDLFRSRLDQPLNKKHPLFVLADRIDWQMFESDESAVARFLENPYWQYFCGFEYFQHELPLDSSSLVRWRKRLGAERLEKLETAIAYPTETKKKSPPKRASSFCFFALCYVFFPTIWFILTHGWG